ncbi:hypothetical protein [Thermomonas sp.]|uniref:hypothetical protein n=1 Tax=Thermomonas sp. TaxID=1971895 RepID=UPI002C2721A5|nr:hypothetical protein [Thermomonas sp.]HRO63588.1 hypothetical protein [Thermomonas sp.]
MKRRLDKVRKLVRFREFRESVAVAEVRQRLVEMHQASRVLDSARFAMEDAEFWKERSLAGECIDMNRYAFALEGERQAMNRHEAAERELEDRQRYAGEAAGQWRQAASATHAARDRMCLENQREMEIVEKRMFDQLSDLLLSRRTGMDRHD